MRRTPGRILLPLALGLAALVLWDTVVAYPFRVFVVFLHEISHGLAAVLTGGRIVSIGLSIDEGGVCVTRGGWRFVVLSAPTGVRPGLASACHGQSHAEKLHPRARDEASTVTVIGGFFGPQPKKAVL